MIFQLQDKCLKVDKPNAKAIIDGFIKNGVRHRQSIWLAVRDLHFPALLTMQRSNTPYKVSHVGRQFNLDGFNLPLKYAVTLVAEYFVKNEMRLWETLCSNGLFDIWNPIAPYTRFVQAKSNPKKFRIQLLRIYEIEREFHKSDIVFTTDRIDTLISQNKLVKSKAPLISDSDFSSLQYLLEQSINSYLSTDPRYYTTKSKKWPSWSEMEREADQIEKQIRINPIMSKTEKETVINARRGQGKFRESVLILHKSCPFTGISNPLFLKAGHIKPWAKCETNEERLDPHNGLALSPAADHLIDQGYISFDDEGRAIFSSLARPEELNLLGFMPDQKRYKINIINEKHLSYIKFHRNFRFKK
jgi:hypothetical protein